MQACRNALRYISALYWSLINIFIEEADKVKIIDSCLKELTHKMTTEMIRQFCVLLLRVVQPKARGPNEKKEGLKGSSRGSF